MFTEKLSMLQTACSSVSFSAWITSCCLHSKTNYITSQGPNAAATEYRSGGQPCGVMIVVLLYWLAWQAVSGYLYDGINVAGNAPNSSDTPLATSELPQAPKSETTEHESNQVPEKHLSSLLVAGISISSVFIFLLVITGVWYARKKSKGSSAEINCVASGEPGVFLKRISMHENQREWPFEGALQWQRESSCMTLWSVHLCGSTVHTMGLGVSYFSFSVSTSNHSKIIWNVS